MQEVYLIGFSGMKVNHNQSLKDQIQCQILITKLQLTNKCSIDWLTSYSVPQFRERAYQL